MILDKTTRLREEDPFTGRLAEGLPSWIVVERSRFEVDLNRDRDSAVYKEPEDSWGLRLWETHPPDAIVETSLALYDSFYSSLREALDHIVDRHDGFVLFDVHSYNHRRQGPGEPPESELENPEVNLGTGSLPEKWKPVSQAFLDTMNNHGVDARENVKFRGRQVAQWVHSNYGHVGCALAIEFRKSFMDEWTGELFADEFARLQDLLAKAGVASVEAWAQCR